MSDSVQPRRQQPTKLPRSWDSPGKNTGVRCHFLLQCMKVKSESEVAQSRVGRACILCIMFWRPEYSKGADWDRPLNSARQALGFHQITSFHLFLPSPNQERGTALFHHRPTGHRSWKFMCPRAEGMEWCRINDLGLRMKWMFPGTRKGILSVRDISALCSLFSLAGKKF